MENNNDQSPSNSQQVVSEELRQAAIYHAHINYARASQQSQEDADYIQAVAFNSYIAGAASIQRTQQGRDTKILIERLLNEIKRLDTFFDRIQSGTHELIDEAELYLRHSPTKTEQSYGK